MLAVVAVAVLGGLAVVILDRADDGPARGDDVRSTTEAVWRAAGVDPADATGPKVRGRTYRTTGACQHLPVDDRWATVGSSRVGPGRASQGDVVDGVRSALEDRGFAVTGYVSPASGTRHLLGVAPDDEQQVELYVDAGGATTVRVLAGPCAVPLAVPPDPPYVEDDA